MKTHGLSHAEQVRSILVPFAVNIALLLLTALSTRLVVSRDLDRIRNYISKSKPKYPHELQPLIAAGLKQKIHQASALEIGLVPVLTVALSPTIQVTRGAMLTTTGILAFAGLAYFLLIVGHGHSETDSEVTVSIYERLSRIVNNVFLVGILFNIVAASVCWGIAAHSSG